MKKRLSADVIREAFLVEPSLLNDLSEEDRKFTVDYFINGGKATLPSEKIASIKRSISCVAVNHIADMNNKLHHIKPNHIWKSPDEMKEYLNEWIKIGSLISFMSTNPSDDLVKLLIKNLFEFHVKFIDSAKFIVNHKCTKELVNDNRNTKL